jgi:heat shock protein HtpX
MIKRVFLFFMTNLLVMLSLGILWSLLSAFTPLGQMIRGNSGLLLLCFFWGMGGAFISLLASRWIARISTGAQILDPATASGDERWLLETVQRLARQAGITEMPQVAIYPAAELNAFATGPSKNRSLVAVSEGLLGAMNKGEIEGVLAHEISHVGNGDMVTLTLLQGVVNSFVMFLSWILALAVSQAMRGRDDERDSMGSYFLRSMIHNMIQMVLMFAAYFLIIAPFSSWREFRADAGGAEKSGKAKMIAALEALLNYGKGGELKQAEAEANAAAPALAAFKINRNRSSFFSTHPPLEERIARLRRA